MRVTLGPRNHLVTIVVSVGIALSVLLLAVATLGATTNSSDDRSAVTPAPDAATQDTGVVNPWAAGDAAALRELADLGRAHLVTADAQPIVVADAYHGVGVLLCPDGTQPVEIADSYHGVGITACP